MISSQEFNSTLYYVVCIHNRNTFLANSDEIKILILEWRLMLISEKAFCRKIVTKTSLHITQDKKRNNDISISNAHPNFVLPFVQDKICACAKF